MTNLNIKDIEQIELPARDLSVFIGRDTVIEKVYAEPSKYGFVMWVESAELDASGIRAKAMLGLHKDLTGKLGFGKNTKCGRFMARAGVTKPTELKGMAAKVQITTNKNGDNEFLTVVPIPKNQQALAE